MFVEKYSWILLLIFIVTVRGAYNDYRCKCICNNLPNESTSYTTMSKKVYIQSVESENCRCRHMMPYMDEAQCLRCECKYQSRKTKIVEVIVWIVISVISSLTVYMVVLQLLESLCKKKADTNFMIKMNTNRSVSSPGGVKIIKQNDKINTKHINSSELDHFDDLPFANRDQFQADSADEGHDGSFSCQKPDGSLTPRMRTKSETVSDVVNRARYEQDRWRGTVKMQRDRVFNEHTILN